MRRTYVLLGISYLDRRLSSELGRHGEQAPPRHMGHLLGRVPRMGISDVLASNRVYYLGKTKFRDISVVEHLKPYFHRVFTANSLAIHPAVISSARPANVSQFVFRALN